MSSVIPKIAPPGSCPYVPETASRQADDSVSLKVMELMLDVILDVMKAERGSIMVLDKDSQDLSILTARGLKEDIIRKTRVRLGSGISGKAVLCNEPILLREVDGERRSKIDPNDFVNTDIKASYIVPIKIHDSMTGTVNISSLQPNHAINAQNEQLVQEIVRRFTEFLGQIEAPAGYTDGPSQLYMMNIFRDYNVIREFRSVFDFIFHLITDLLGIEKKGVFLLKNKDSRVFDMILGYGFDFSKYREIYEELLPCIRSPQIEGAKEISILKRTELSNREATLVPEDFFILLPLIWREATQGQVLILSDEPPPLPDPFTHNVIRCISENAARAIVTSSSMHKFDELTLTDSLTGLYNHGLWWKRLHEEFSRAKRMKDAMISIVVFDLDHFERINVAHGYLVGDELLRVVADHIKSRVRIPDIVGRIGGEEFGLVLPGAAKQDALRIANRIAESISDTADAIHVHLTESLVMSGGVATYPEDADSPGTLVEKAKVALLSAKIMGGNRVMPYRRQEE